ncbi:MAG TPA: YdbL family protein [Sphingomicrobium sp.]|jgi:uncharacterized protein YdbL (DUF1318 family)
MRCRIVFLVVALAGAAPLAAQGPSQVSAAVAAGTVGERYDGFLGFVTPPGAELRRQVNAINIKRRSLYFQLATGRNATADLVALTTACELFARLPVGHAYMLQDGAWRRRAAGQSAPVPDYCR